MTFDARTEAFVRGSVTYGSLDGTGYEAKLRKIEGEWFVVDLGTTWIS